ncbi:Hypothetical Protein FCC1311_017872 [Hondaea fermentalgiana]|uniref:Uncharacterized protein n=1 Tax=Hondaea fermentalgiana TaxID=2315210 RepID=A0A2R5G6Z7_9STRA|nr:Hypothetical Protein FCC1311_017872 [Hondaea fermentalgiana]|eukprot:GBG25568.1 Hypothetical Protein FCC1311_017872 [Hondaea fermentalgiana]
MGSSLSAAQLPVHNLGRIRSIMTSSKISWISKGGSNSSGNSAASRESNPASTRRPGYSRPRMETVEFLPIYVPKSPTGSNKSL